MLGLVYRARLRDSGNQVDFVNTSLTLPGHAALAALVVEDNALVAETIADGLGELGYSTVKTVGSVEKAINVVSRDLVDMAIVETSVGSRSTQPVLDALGANNTAHVVVATSTWFGSRPTNVPYLEKPFGFYQLRTAVNDARDQASIRSRNRRP